MTKVIETKRLRLRPFELRDAKPMASLIADWDVIRWLTSPPWPYFLSDAEWFIGDDSSNGSYAIETESTFAGVVGLTASHDLGYWLGKPFHGQGIMTEAANGLLKAHFDAGHEHATSGYVLGNKASSNVLGKLGFRDTAIKTEKSNPMNKQVQVQKMELTANDWRMRNA